MTYYDNMVDAYFQAELPKYELCITSIGNQEPTCKVDHENGFLIDKEGKMHSISAINLTSDEDFNLEKRGHYERSLTAIILAVATAILLSAVYFNALVLIGAGITGGLCLLCGGLALFDNKRKINNILNEKLMAHIIKFQDTAYRLIYKFEESEKGFDENHKAHRALTHMFDSINQLKKRSKEREIIQKQQLARAIWEVCRIGVYEEDASALAYKISAMVQLIPDKV